MIKFDLCCPIQTVRSWTAWMCVPMLARSRFHILPLGSTCALQRMSRHGLM